MDGERRFLANSQRYANDNSCLLHVYNAITINGDKTQEAHIAQREGWADPASRPLEKEQRVCNKYLKLLGLFLSFILSTAKQYKETAQEQLDPKQPVSRKSARVCAQSRVGLQRSRVRLMLSVLENTAPTCQPSPPRSSHH